MNPQSRGTITLGSSNPSDSPIIDPNFLSHPFDKRTMIEGMRTLKKMLSAPVFANKTTKYLGPEDESEAAILVSTPFLAHCSTYVTLKQVLKSRKGTCTQQLP